MQKAIAIDFDGCLCENKYPDIGEPIFPDLNVNKGVSVEQMMKRNP